MKDKVESISKEYFDDLKNVSNKKSFGKYGGNFIDADYIALEKLDKISNGNKNLFDELVQDFFQNTRNKIKNDKDLKYYYYRNINEMIEFIEENEGCQLVQKK